MKRIKDLISRPFVTAALFALALVLLGGSTVGGARAALTVESDLYNSQVVTSNIDVTLVENGNAVGTGGKLLGDLLKRNGDKAVQFGKPYKEDLRVRNTGTIAEYVRVSVYRYWVDENGNKAPDMDTGWIELGFVTGNGWSEDESSRTTERTVLYYADPLGSGQDSNPFLSSVTINEKAARKVTQTEDGGVIMTTYVYNGKSFCVEVHVDGVQTHNADKAKTSAWGVNK